MKYVIFLLAIIAFACSSKSINFPQEGIVLKLNEKYTTNGVVITLKQVTESRCPLNADCIRAGEAVAVFNVVVDNNTERNISLCTGADCVGRGLSDTYTFSLENKKYFFKLDSITPFPNMSQNGQEEKKVYFSVSQP